MSIITLREAVPEDAARLAFWETIDGDTPVSEDRMLEFIAEHHTLQNNDQQRFVIDNEGEAVGTVDFTNRTADGKGAYLSIYIDKQHRAKGVGTKAMQQAVNRATDFGLKRLGAIIKDNNLVSQALFTSAGFVPVDTYHNDTEATVWLLDIAKRHVKNPA